MGASQLPQKGMVMKQLLKALDAAFTTFVNEVFPFPVFPSLDDVPDEIVRREELEEVWEPQSSSAPDPSPGVADERPGSVSDSPPTPDPGHSKLDRYVLFGCAADIYEMVAGSRPYNKSSLMGIANRIEDIAMK